MPPNTSLQPAETQSNAAQPSVVSPAPVETPNPFASDTATTAQPAVERVQAQPAAAREVDAQARSDARAPAGETKEFWDLLSGEFGDLPGLEDLKLDGFYKDLKPELVRDLPTPAKQIVHNLRRAHELAKADFSKKEQAFAAERESEKQAFYQKEKDLIRREQEFAAMIEDPKVQAVLKGPEGELPDPFTQEGIEARIKKGIAEGLQTVFRPIQASAEDRRRELAWMEFYEANPQMQEEAFRNEMGIVLEERKAKGAPISTQDAFRLVRLGRLEAEEQKRNAQERAARATSASRVSRTTATGAPAHQEIPDHVKKNASSLYTYLKEHPEAARQVNSGR